MMRQYSGWYARFTQPDPSDGSYDLSDPRSLNRYAYVNGDPVNYVDPSGLNPVSPGTSFGGAGMLWSIWWGNVTDGFRLVHQFFEPYPNGGSQLEDPSDRRLTAQEVTTLARGMMDMLSNATCRDFVRQLLDEVQAQTGVKSRGLLDTLFQVSEQRGIYTGERKTAAAGGYATGGIEYNNARILLLPPIDHVGLKGQMAEEFRLNVYDTIMDTILHETMHQAGLGYHDVTMARALNAIRIREGTEAPREFPLRGPTAQLDMANASLYWAPALKLACNPRGIKK